MHFNTPRNIALEQYFESFKSTRTPYEGTYYGKPSKGFTYLCHEPSTADASQCLFIEQTARGYHLVIENESWLDRNLETLELKLCRWAAAEGYDFEISN